MSERRDRPPASYEIEVAVRLRGRSRDAFPELAVRDGPTGSVLVGALRDQAALHGVLGRLRDLGIPLVSVRRIQAGEAGGGRATPS